MNNLNIRSATTKDAHAIAEIHVLGWRTTYRRHMPDDMLDNLSIAQKEQQWQERLEKSECHALVAEVDHKVVGFISFGVCRDDDLNPKVTAEITAVYLLPEYKGKKIGYELTRQALENLRQQEYHEVIFWVLSDNQVVRSFCEKMGFTLDPAKSAPAKIAGVVLCDCRYRKVL